MTTSAAGMLASGLAATSLLSVLIFKLIKSLNAGAIHTGVVLASFLSLVPGLLLMYMGHVFAFTILTAICVYPSVVLGAALANSHIVNYQQRGHPILNLEAMMLQQEIFQSAVGPAVGLYFGRTVLGDPVSTFQLGLIYSCIATSQIFIVLLGWNPDFAVRSFQVVFGKPPSEHKRRSDLTLASGAYNMC
ncbi:hypothetical protein EMIHUDRAFT_371665 [Emiliania huxleyi CCMP1516]|uniref:Major facilitator superfamily (MFS) profile domain-containing protein n=2 Tax=Emiliania huxleyi TaxID=2903 RepID=A0A0D3IH11_EMIH1|nr:hypothetical protein EMIHUDRAFT_371665 [Emiliania huxleyi CCMP1516]EOD10546.1 hypothetical protein EMIHUDRAFT_371665 [Emiliania huxleyi CCMP1516]|eukprot:XP_005762975.1 hypothetical protein EMIHUDRAFT_371665 [Emiliania huxleyi CCMP1516]